MSTEFYWIAVAVVTVMSAARITRLLTWDKFPPVVYMRDAYAEWTDKSDRRRGWQLLAFCGYCMSFWVTAVIIGWAYWAGVLDAPTQVIDGEWSGWSDLWWIVNSIFAVSYASAIVMALDQDDA